MPEHASVNEHQDGGLVIAGNIDFYTSPDLLKRTCGLMKPGMKLEISFNGVEHVDSSAAALMLECLREADKRDIELSYTALPRKLLNLLSVCGLEGRLPIQS